ncbi:MAG: TadE family protein [Planctomycetota bacterium]
MIKKLLSLWKDDEGAAATEFALVLPMLLIILYGNMFFHELILLKLHVIKCARYVAFELTCRPESGVASYVAEFNNDHKINTDSTVITVENFLNADSVFNMPGGSIRPHGEQLAYRVLMLIPAVTYQGIFGESGLISLGSFNPSLLTGFFEGETRESGLRGVNGTAVGKDLMTGQVRGDYVSRWSALGLLFEDRGAKNWDSDTTSGAVIPVCGTAGDSYGRIAILVNDWRSSGGNVINSDDAGLQHSIKARVHRVWSASIFDSFFGTALSKVNEFLSYLGAKFLDFKDVVSIDALGQQNIGGSTPPDPDGDDVANDEKTITSNDWRMTEFR